VAVVDAQPVPQPSAQALAVSVATAVAAVRQSALAPLLADLAQAVAMPSVPAPVQQAISQVLAAQTPLDPPPNATQLQQATAASGVFLEAQLGAGAPPPTGDLKSALLVVQQVLQTWLDSAPASASPVLAALATPPAASQATTSQTPGAPAPPNPGGPVVAPPTASSGSPFSGDPNARHPPSNAALAEAEPPPAPAGPINAAEASPPPTTAAPELPISAPPTVASQAAGVQANGAQTTAPQTPAAPPPAGAASSSAPDPTATANAPPSAPGSPPLPLAEPLDFGADTEIAAGQTTPAQAATAAASGPTTAPPAAQPPPPPFRGGPTTAQSPSPASLSIDADPGAVARRLLAATSGAVARQQLHQIASLPEASTQPGQRTAEANSRWMFELPFATASGAAVAQFEISRDGGGASAEGEATWRARFSIDLEPMGPVHAQVALTGARAGVTLWAERPATAKQLRAQQDVLSAGLEDASFAAAVQVHVGAPPHTPPPAGRFLDQAS